MSSYCRNFNPGGSYFFTVVTYQRSTIFDCEARVNILRAAFTKVKLTQPFVIDAIVVLPDHLHCIWTLPPRDTDFSSRWREIKKATSRFIDKRTNARNERPVWQRRFWEHTIRDETDWRRHIDYIHYNPVKHGLVDNPMRWQWSSIHHAVKLGWYDVEWGKIEPNEIVGMDVE